MQSDADAIIHIVTYPHPIARVWFALTDADALARWLMPNDFRPPPRSSLHPHCRSGTRLARQHRL
jgi:uncharacterized protein YndB with AHSA1/START domain